jgi:rare lipoprotein A
MRQVIIGLSALLLAASCVSHKDAFTTREATYRGHYKVGKEYQIKQSTYKPKEVYGDYEKVGVASWYGPGFYGNKTANGEIFTGQDFTAAHNTLPLPSIIRVVNLENQKAIIVRVNDRGPFNDGKRRILDLSEHAAETLGMKHKGTARVRIKLLHNATQLLHKKLGIIKMKKSIASAP